MATVRFFCPFHLSGPSYGGSYRVLGLVRALARRGHRVRVDAFVLPHQGRPRSWLDAAGAEMHEHLDVLGLAAGFHWLRVAPRFLTVSAVARANRLRIPADPPCDVAVYEYPWLWRIPGVRSRLDVYDAHNCEADWFESDLAGVPFADRWRRFAREAERRAWREAGVVWCTSAADEARLTTLYGDRRATAIVPNGLSPRAPVDASTRAHAKKALGIPPETAVGLFVAFDSRPNVEALHALADAFRRRDTPGSVVLVAGKVGATLRNPPPAFRLLGYRDDLDAIAAAADVALNPMATGSGSNTKVAEALGRGLPLVTTEFGLRGFESLRPFVDVASVPDFPSALGQAAHRPRRDVPFEAFRWDRIAEGIERTFGF